MAQIFPFRGPDLDIFLESRGFQGHSGKPDWPWALSASCRIAAPRRTTREASMYAIIQTGGKQYRVAEGEILRI
ncbi:MAG TPA: hypothetical protein VNV60_10110, partial [Holophagaceae bacterium]|nr:hypothetical protein [Holophagaceae bacterium]